MTDLKKEYPADLRKYADFILYLRNQQYLREIPEKSQQRFKIASCLAMTDLKKEYPTDLRKLRGLYF